MMKPATAFVLLAFAAGLGGCQSQSLALASASAAYSKSILGEPEARSSALHGEMSAPNDNASGDEGVANLDDFYREKLGIDPRILYASAEGMRGEVRPMSEFGSAAGQ